MPGPDIEIVVQTPAWRRRIPALGRFARDMILATHDAAIGDGAPAIASPVALAFADDTAVQALNGQFRDKDKPTNVLSFPGRDGGGDIILALQTVAAEAAAQGKSFRDHTAHLIAHGILHLMGYDHMARGEARRMERLERSILARLGIADPYVDNRG
jgi:probable rRNA maturation factor